MRKSVDVESVNQNFIGQTNAHTNTIFDVMSKEKLYSLKK